MGDMAVLSADAVEHPEALGDRTPVQITFSVDQYLKGSGPNPLQLYQPAAQISYDGGQITGILTSGTSCGALISTGDRYVVLLQQSGYEMLAGSSKLGSDDENNFILGEIAKVLSEPGALPVVGTGPGLQHSDSPAAQLPLVLLAVGGVTLASGALLLGRRLR